jgi:RNA polymerase sigma factor (sigma-70 family)
LHIHIEPFASYGTNSCKRKNIYLYKSNSYAFFPFGTASAKGVPIETISIEPFRRKNNMKIPIGDLAHLVGSSPQFMVQLTDDQQKKLRRFIHKRVLNPEDADDLLQLTYLEAWRNRERFSGQATLSTWMCGIAQNLIRNHFRRMYAKPVHCEFDESLWHGQEERNSLDWEFEVNRRLEKTLNAIDHLPVEMRKTLYASLETDGSYQDTADALDIPIGTVRSRLSRAREQLKRVTHNPPQP